MGLIDRVEADISRVFLRSGDFAHEARFTHAGSAPVRFNCIYHERYEPTDVFSTSTHNGNPAASCAAADVEGVEKDDSFEVKIDGAYVQFYVLDPQEAEEGMRLLILSTNPVHG